MRLRNLDHEREFIEHAARGVVNPDRLIEFCQMRAGTLSGEYVPDPMLVRLDVDQPLEVREEIADGINRLVWWLEDHLAVEGLRDRRMAALRHLVMAYDLIVNTG
jgi:hypothetical protein